jgi:mannose-6-phosphate isomerase
MLYPLTFHPIFKERVWGGHRLQELYGKPLPPAKPIGESWEISDRPGDVSVIANGPLAGNDLHWLMLNHRTDLLGDVPDQNGRFPWLIKILDAQEKLSLQVHPPAHKALELGGDPKTEMWYIAEAAPGAELFVGLKRGISRKQFEQQIEEGTVAECFHRVQVRKGDAMFLPSGRVHALGAGLVIFEIQQNSDTTYRVFDWNRLGLDGKPRELHIGPSLESIDFQDFEPGLVFADPADLGSGTHATLVQSPLFRVSLFAQRTVGSMTTAGGALRILGVTEGKIIVTDPGSRAIEVMKGQFCLVPAAVKRYEVWFEAGTSFLLVEPGQ